MEKTLFPQQAAHRDLLAQAVKKFGAALDASHTGCGKTICAIETAKALGLTPFVVAPKPILTGWRRALQDQKMGFVDIVGWEKLRTGNTPWLKPFARSFKWSVPDNTLIIFDEVHKAKSHKSKNSKMVTSARAQNLPLLMLSATAAENPAEMRAIGYALKLHHNRDFWTWAQAWGCEFNEWKSLEFKGYNRALLTELNKQIFPERGSKLTREDLGAYFTQCQIITDPIDFKDGNKIKALCDELEAELATIRDARVRDGRDALAITKILRLRQEIELLKIPTIAEMVEDDREAGNSVVVFLNFRESLAALSRRLKEAHGIIQGGQTDTQRQRAMEEFQANITRILLANIAAGGVGISLHDEHGGHPRIALVSPTYNVRDFEQSLGRIDRVGGKTDTLQRILVAGDTIEERIANSLKEKKLNLDLLLKQGGVLNHSQHMQTNITTPAPQEEHDPYGPSTQKYIRACAGYLSDDTTNPSAEMGTRIHKALETGDYSPLNDYETFLAHQCEDARTRIIALHQMQRGVVSQEVRLHIPLGGGYDTFGTCDYLSVYKNKALALDYKTGVWPIDEVEINDQAIAYAVGILERHPEVEVLDFYFLVPRRDEIIHGQFQRTDLPKLTFRVKTLIANAKKVHSCFSQKTITAEMLTPAEQVCAYCARAGNGCPAIEAKALQIAKAYQDTFPIPEEVHGSADDDPERISKLLKLAPVIVKWAEGVRHKANELMIERGIEIPDFEIKEKNSARSIKSALAAYGLVRDHVSLEDFLDKVGSISVGEYEKLISDFTPKGKKKKAVAEIMAELFEMDVISGGEPTKIIQRKKEKA